MSSQTAVLWRGPSAIDGRPIKLVCTGHGSRPSRNKKTGPMSQLYIMPVDMAPVEASRTGADESICGDCSARHSKGGWCYVVTMHLTATWRAARKAATTPLARVADLIKRRPVRIGAHGDPAAIPVSVWRAVFPKRRHSHTGYTHLWRRPEARALASLVMASCDSTADHHEARALGFRTFTTVPPGVEPPPGAVQCPYDTHGVQCAECLLCDGNARNDSRPCIWVREHGARARKGLTILQ